MINSMTGYGRGSASVDGFTFSAELRSVNHRYADLALRLPRELYFLEERIRRLLLESVTRGRVELNLTLDEMPSGLHRAGLDEELAAGYRQALQQLSERLELNDQVRLEHLLQVPDLFKPEKMALTAEQVWPAAAAALREALQNLIRQRRSEGENLCRDLLGRCQSLAAMVDSAARRAEEAKEESRLRTEQKFSDLLAGQFEETRLIMECAILVERMGVDEELLRLRSHLDAFQATLSGSDPAGRKLDFIAQEMFREINTIGSKAGDYSLTGIVVEMKAELEKIREQIQNLE